MAFPTITMGTGHESSVTPPSHTDNDWLVLYVETTSGTVTTPSGWTPWFSIPAGTANTTIAVFKRKVGVSETVGDAALAGGSNHLWGVIARFRGAHAKRPFSAPALAYMTSATTTAFAPGTETKYKESLVVQGFSWALDSAGALASGWANSSLANVTEQYDAGTATGDGGGLSIATGELTTPGIVGPGTATITSSVGANFTFAVRPSAPTTGFSKSGTVEDADGNPAANGGTVHIIDLDDSREEIVATATIAGGAGGYTANVESNGTNRYCSRYDNGTDPPGISAPWTAA